MRIMDISIRKRGFMMRNYAFNTSGSCRTARISAFILMCALSVMAFSACEKNVEPQNVRLAEAEAFSVALSCTTAEKTGLVLSYGEGFLFDRQAFVRKPATEHFIRIQGLKPSTRYRYRFSPNGEIRSFRTAPQEDGVFDLVFLDEASAGTSTESSGAASLPDLVLTVGNISTGLASHPAEILTKPIPDSGTLRLVYGSVIILAAKDAESARKALEKEEQDGKRIMILLPALPQTPNPAFEKAILLSPREASYQGRIVSWAADQPAWLEVDAFEIAWVHGSSDKRERRVVVEAPPDARRSCLFCDRLMESGRYEESIRWYENFIAENSESPESVADARFSIAGIYDSKLFRYREAIAMYNDFLANHPGSRRAALARFRIEQLNRYSGDDFAPLGAFERAKAQLDPKKPEEAAQKVEDVLKKYPEAAIAEEALFWLGHLLEQIQPEKARGFYEELMRRYPKSENAAMSAVSLGDMDYMSKNYSSAMVRYETALSLTPEKYHVPIKEKLAKSARNVWRERARWTSWILLAFWLVLSAVYRARPHLRDMLTGSLILSVYVLLFGVYFIKHYESAEDIVLPVAAAALSSTLILMWNRALMHSGIRTCAVVLHLVTATAAAIFLVMYHFHMLFPFGI